MTKGNSALRLVMLRTDPAARVHRDRETKAERRQRAQLCTGVRRVVRSLLFYCP